MRSVKWGYRAICSVTIHQCSAHPHRTNDTLSLAPAYEGQGEIGCGEPALQTTWRPFGGLLRPVGVSVLRLLGETSPDILASGDEQNFSHNTPTTNVFRFRDCCYSLAILVQDSAGCFSKSRLLLLSMAGPLSESGAAFTTTLNFHFYA